MECEFCKKEFSTKYNLINQYCLEKQGKTLIDKNKCKHCLKLFTTEQSLLIHIEKCKVKSNEKDITKLELKIRNLENELKHSIITNKELDTKHKKEILEIKNYNDKTVKNLQL